MKKRIRLSEAQLNRMIRQAINEEIDYGGFVYGSDAIQINSEEDLDNLLHQWTTTGDFQSWKEAIAPKIKMGDYIMPVKCGDHGGELYDWAAIEYFKSFYPDNINTIESQYGVEMGFIWGDENFLNDKLETITDDYLSEIRSKAADKEVKYIEEQYGIQLDDETKDELFDFFYECACPRNTFEYRDSDLEDILKEHGYLSQGGENEENDDDDKWGNVKESVARKITEDIIKKLRRV